MFFAEMIKGIWGEMHIKSARFFFVRFMMMRSK
jgi:hypothetical protein